LRKNQIKGIQVEVEVEASLNLPQT
jgi:hypothetical protein